MKKNKIREILMNDEYYIKKVEEVLKIFPSECRRNYYDNKQSLRIYQEDVIFQNLYGNYDHEENIITLYKISSLPHELFHMAFRDKKKVNQKIYDESDIIYKNGVAYQFSNDINKILQGKGLTEGFAEYLSRKCTDTKGHSLLYYFTDLLISIYGKDIIYYALRNDPVGFFEDERFFEIYEFSHTLDLLDKYSESIKFVSNNYESLQKVFKMSDNEEKMRLSQFLDTVRQGFKKSIIQLFQMIIDEYNHCDNSKIAKDDFINKLLRFISNSDYNIYFRLDDSILSIEKEINAIINEFSEGKKKVL